MYFIVKSRLAYFNKAKHSRQDVGIKYLTIHNRRRQNRSGLKNNLNGVFMSDVTFVKRVEQLKYMCPVHERVIKGSSEKI